MFCTSIDINALEYKAPTSNRSGGKVVHVSTVAGSADYKHRLRFQMSEDDKQNLQSAVWGLSTPLPGQDTSRRTLELSIESPDLLTFLEALDQKNLRTATAQSPEWFRKTVDDAAIKQMYVSLVKEPNKPEHKPTVRVKVKTGEYPTNIYIVQDVDADGNLSYVKGGAEDLTRNAKCLVIAETVGLWFMSRQFGMSLTATEVLVWPNRASTGIDAFTMSGTTKLQRQIATAPAVADDCDMLDE
tara:strand:+ start:2756 stop:3484 length:729 start_codon:yes stop_codon:yes gene_type:complete